MVSEWIYLCEALCDCKNLSFPFVWIFATPWTVAQQAPLSMGFPRQEYWCGLPFPPPGDHPNPGIEPTSPTLAGIVSASFAVHQGNGSREIN